MTKLNAYTDRGKGFPILFIHAFPLNRHMWAPQVDALQHHYRVVTFDLHGFGDTPPVEHEMSMEMYADEIITLLDHVKIQNCFAVGLSLGGYILFALLKKYPERLRGIILSDTRATADTEEGKKNRYAQAAEVRAHGMNTLINGMLQKLVGEYTKQHRSPVLLSLRSLMQQASSEGTARMLMTMAEREDSTPLLTSIKIPVCCIVGDEDTLTPVSDMRAIHEKIPGSELYIIPKAGHVANIEAPETFNAIIKQFCDRYTKNNA